MFKLLLSEVGSGTDVTLKGRDVWLRLRSGGFSPALLFGQGEQGAWFDPSPTTTFTDTARTVPATVGQAVAGMTDLSGRGNHATQATVAARPILARVPASGRRNLLTRTEEFDNAAWAKGSFTGTISANTAETLDPIGGNTAEKFDATVAGSFVQQAIVTTVQTYTYSFYAKAGTAGTVRVNVFDTSDHRAVFNLSDGSLASSFGITASSSVGVGNGWWRFAITYTAGAAANQTRVFCPDVGVVYIWGAQLEQSPAVSNYQRVGSTFDVTEAGQPDNFYLADVSSDSITWPAPAGTYTLAYIATGGIVTIASGQVLSGATNILQGARTGSYIAVDRALTPAEIERTTAYLQNKGSGL